MQVANLPVQSSNNPFRSRADSPNAGDPPSHTDLDISPSALERSPPSPTGGQSRSPTPEVTGSSNSTGAGNLLPTESPAHSPRQYAPPPGPPPGHTTASAPPALEEAITEELPPAYTPTADVRQGETSIEFGPRRPFAQTSARGSGTQRTQRAATNSAWSTYPGRGVMPAGRIPPGAPLIHVSPPPQHPALPPRSGGPRSAPPQQSARPMSDFARDFYTARPDQGGTDTSLMGGSSSQYESTPDPSRAPPMPPRPTADIGGVGNESNAQERISDDGRPTTKPVPGHPLLNSGKVLVYPAGYECAKCHNTGYKHYDPSNPCSKCWSKYAKVFSGPLTYAPWAPASGAAAVEASGSAGHNLQRPLPTTVSRSASMTHRASHSMTDLAAPPTHPDIGRSSSTRQPSTPYARAQPVQASPTGWPPTSWTSGNSPPPPRTTYSYGAPPGATVVRPGDPRIGGNLCWRCQGSGVTSFLIFDEQTCTVCNGLGRTF